MEYRRLGTTGMDVAVLGLGTGGANRFGQAREAGPGAAAALVRTALDLGINYFDTAHAYGLSEDMLGAAFAGVPRSSYLVATKYTHRDASGGLRSEADVDAAIRLSLRRLRVDVLDVMQIHALKIGEYDEVIDRHLPVLVRAQEAGLIRSIGVTESFGGDDPKHLMLQRALADRLFGVVMVGYNVLNQNPERAILPMAEESGTGVVIMAAVRRTLRSTEALEAQIAELKASGDLAANALPDRDPLGWLVATGASSVQSACYRYATDPIAVSTVLTGTFNPDHLRENASAMGEGRLPVADRDRLRSIFGHLEQGLGR